MTSSGSSSFSLRSAGAPPTDLQEMMKSCVARNQSPFDVIAVHDDDDDDDDDSNEQQPTAGTRFCGLSTVDDARSVHFLHLPTNNHTTFELPYQPTCVAWSPCGRHVIIGDSYGSLHFCNLHGTLLFSQSVFKATTTTEDVSVRAVTFVDSLEGNTMAAVSSSKLFVFSRLVRCIYFFFFFSLWLELELELCAVLFAVLFSFHCDLTRWLLFLSLSSSSSSSFSLSLSLQ